MRLEQKTILILIFLAVLVPIVSATYEVTQGDTVYAGETVDISRVLSWKMQFAYWISGDYGGDSPDKIITVSGYMYNYYIDPQLYEPGTYWKWDGKEESASNPIAFYVKNGVRPEPTIAINNTTNTTQNGTSTINVTPTLPPLPLGENVLVARGDRGILNYQIDSTKLINGHPQKAYLWLFGGKSKILGSPVIPNATTNTIYTYEFNSTVTETLEVGTYVGYLQFGGQNNQQDVFYDPINNTLDSRFKAVVPVNLDPFLPARIMHEFERMEVPSIYTDDLLVPITIDVQDPTLTISDYGEEGDNIVIQGTTNLEEGSDIVAMIDPDNFAILTEIAAHKYSSKAIGNYSAIRIYSVSIPIKWEELNIGQHTFRVSAVKNKIKLDVYKDFQVSGIWIMPTPTPELKKVMVEEYGSHQLPTSTPTIKPTKPTPTPTPLQVVSVNGTVRNLTTRNQTIINPMNSNPNTTTNTTVRVTPRPTPVPTMTTEPVPTDDIVIPLNPALSLFAIVILGFILKRK